MACYEDFKSPYAARESYFDDGSVLYQNSSAVCSKTLSCLDSNKIHNNSDSYCEVESPSTTSFIPLTTNLGTNSLCRRHKSGTKNGNDVRTSGGETTLCRTLSQSNGNNCETISPSRRSNDRYLDHSSSFKYGRRRRHTSTYLDHEGVNSTTCNCQQSNGVCDVIESHLDQLGNGKTWLGIFLGQVLSIILMVSALTTVYLTDVYKLHIPTAQNFAFYLVLCCVFTTTLACRTGESNLFPILRARGWKYALLALMDSQANVLVVKAYQLTTLPSVQLLDCFSIPAVLSFSWLVVHVRYRVVHILGVSICLLGVCCLVWADIEDGRPVGHMKERFIGDMMSLSGAFFFGISNVAEEFVVRSFDGVEFLGMIGLFGTFFLGAQTFILEYNTLSESNWDGLDLPGGERSWSSSSVILITYVLTRSSYYIVSTAVLKLCGATMMNLSTLTADFYCLIGGICLFQYKFHALYFLSYVLVMIGVMIFSIKKATIPTPIYTSLSRDATATTVDMELVGSNGVATNQLDRRSISGRERTGCVNVNNVASYVENQDDSFSSLSSKNCDVVLQTSKPSLGNRTVSFVGNFDERESDGSQRVLSHRSQSQIQDDCVNKRYVIPEEDIC